jgi:branched-chain amino acid transport system substrate-binding protein
LYPPAPARHLGRRPGADFIVVHAPLLPRFAVPMSPGVIPRRTLLAAGAATLTMPAILRAQTGKLKIGMVTTLSGPGYYLGADIRDGFQLAMADGNLGGVPVELVVEDDGLKPAQARQIISRFINTDGIRLYTGIVFSNVLSAVVGDVLDAGGIYISPNAAPSNLAGQDCNPNYYVVSWQNDSLYESAGQNANLLGYKNMYVLAANYQAGRDAITAFKRYFKGEIVGESYTSLTETDYAAEMAQIRAATPDAVFQFHPGGLGIAFIRQYQQAGLLGKIPMVLAAPSMDAVILKAVGEAAIGINVSSHWNSDFDNVANRRFMTDYLAKYHRMPTYYASQGYDTGLAIGAVLYQTKGRVEDTEAFRSAMLPAQFESVRGKLRFGNNQEPIQDWWGLRVEKDKTGALTLVTKRQVFKNHGDAYAKECKL